MARSRVGQKQGTEQGLKKPPLQPGENPEPGQDNSFTNQIVILFSAPLLTEELK